MSGDKRRRRQEKKLRLIEHHGGICVDCCETFAPYQMQFDHRDPSDKEFEISTHGRDMKYEELLAESLKCDLVCSNCHAQRSHVQRCTGCEHCLDKMTPDC